jgi:hypothetical protein
MEGSLMEFDVLAVLPALDDEDPETGAERLLAGFQETHPDAGAVTSADLARQTFDVAFTVEAGDTYEAIELAKATFATAAEASAVTPRALEAFHVDAVAPARAETRATVPA